MQNYRNFNNLTFFHPISAILYYISEIVALKK